jgi:alkaline phosphatase
MKKLFKLGLFFWLILIGGNLYTHPTIAQIIPPKMSIIIMIGDGMGPTQVEFGRLIEYGEEGNSSILRLPYSNQISTNNIDGDTTDSAASATAIATGVKTSNGRIGMNWDASKNLTSILKIAEQNNYKTGLIATCQITHATPAGFGAQNESRNNYVNIGEDIANSGVDLILAGGSSTSYFGTQISKLESAGFTYVDLKSEMIAANTLPLLGLFASGDLPAEGVRDNNTVPSLSQMTAHALSLFDAASVPFFLMIEGSKIDSGGHANDKLYLAHEVIEFEKAVNISTEYAKSKGNVLLLVTGDHETGGLSILSSNLVSTLPNSTDTIEELRAKREARANEISVTWSTTGHTSTEVYLNGLGPNADKIMEAEHHINTFSIMRYVIDEKTTPEDYNGNSGYIDSIWYYAGAGIAILCVVVIIWMIIKKQMMES